MTALAQTIGSARAQRMIDLTVFVTGAASLTIALAMTIAAVALPASAQPAAPAAHLTRAI